MSCEPMRKKIEAYLDGELTLSEQRAMQEHLAQCSTCQVAYRNLKALSGAIRKIDYPGAPAALRRKVKSGLREVSGEEAARFNGWQLLGTGLGSAALASLCVWLVLSFTAGPRQSFGPADELVSAHVRSLMLNHLTDVVSSEKHTVKPWFNGKLDFSPTVPDLSAQNFQLVGGRLDYVERQPVAVLVYKRRAHLINVFIRRHDAAHLVVAAGSTQQQGYNLLYWEKEGFAYALVSDLNGKELRELAGLLGAPTL